MRHVWLQLLLALSLLGSVTLAGQSSTGPQDTAGDRPEATPETRPQRVRVSEGVSDRLCRKKVKPRYPKDARRAGIQGHVVLQLEIDKNGNVESAAVVVGPPELAPAAVEAVKQWKYKPYLLNGQSVMMETQVVVSFHR